MKRHLPTRLLICAYLLAFAPAPGDTAHAQSRKKTVLLGPEDEPSKQPRQRRRIVTELDEKRAGEQGAKAVAAQIGVLNDEDLDAYVQRMGDKVLRGLPRRSFKYSFAVVDQDEPNAFALPGGFIFISRGLLALAETEDEVANVIGHEIAHVALRHSVRQQAIQQNTNRLVMGYMRAAHMASYGRDMERESDREGQKLAAAAGYDPRGMATFMEAMGDWERIITGQKRRASWFDSHPMSSERAVVNLVRASELRWTRDPSLGDTRTSHLKTIDGMPVGQRPSSGVFQGDRFLHPDLDFQIRFPRGWRKSNSAAAVGAQARDGSVVFMSADVPPGKPKESADKFLEKHEDLRVRKAEPDRIRGADVWRVEAEVGRGTVQLMFLQHRKHTWMMVGAAPPFGGDRKKIENTMRSFRPLTPDQRKSIQATRLQIVEAKAGEGLGEISRRTRNTWDQSRTAVANGVSWTHEFSGGELVKVVQSEPYIPPAESRP